VTGPAGSPASEQRLKGFRDRLAEGGCDSLKIVAGDFHYESGFEAALSLVCDDGPPEAIFRATDLLAIGAIDGLRSLLNSSVG
jgi:DNA-binding LacI/PurR family transcriptional regulator